MMIDRWINKQRLKINRTKTSFVITIGQQRTNFFVLVSRSVLGHAFLEMPNGHMWRLRRELTLTLTGLEKARHRRTYAEHAFPTVTTFKPTPCLADHPRPPARASATLLLLY